MDARIIEMIQLDAKLDKESKERFSELCDDIAAQEFSDILDDEGNQYVNFVQEGSPLSFMASIFDTLKGFNDKTFLTK